MVVFVSEDTEAEVISLWNIDVVVQVEESIGAAGPMRVFRGGEVVRRYWVRRECGEDVKVELFYVHYSDHAESRGEEVGCPKGRH